MKNPSSRLTQMRLDLEEYTFNIEYVKGKENVSADAVSRITIDSDELKTIPCLPIQTRSMTKIQKNKTNIDSSATEIDHLRAYDSVNNLDAFKVPKVTFELINQYTIIRILSKNLKMLISQVKLACQNGGTDLTYYLQIINEMALKSNIKTLAIKNNDKLFSFIPQEVFKQACNRILSDVTIIIYEPTKIITDDETIQRIISENHKTPTGGHIGICRLLNKFRSKYYWNNMKRTTVIPP